MDRSFSGETRRALLLSTSLPEKVAGDAYGHRPAVAPASPRRSLAWISSFAFPSPQLFTNRVADECGTARVFLFHTPIQQGYQVLRHPDGHEFSLRLSGDGSSHRAGVYIEYAVGVNKFLIPGANTCITRPMPNKRAPGQKLLPIAVDERFLRELDAGLAQAGYHNRSQFIRDAIVEKLIRADVPLPKELAMPPNRFGKGGRSADPVSYPKLSSSAYALNDKAAPKSQTSAKSSKKRA
jgi:hypothetical protein